MASEDNENRNLWASISSLGETSSPELMRSSSTTSLGSSESDADVSNERKVPRLTSFKLQMTATLKSPNTSISQMYASTFFFFFFSVVLVRYYNLLTDIRLRNLDYCTLFCQSHAGTLKFKRG